MVFIRPKILRDGFATALATNEKYNYIRDEQRATLRPKSEVLPLIPFSKEPLLPPLPQPLPTATPPGTPTGPDGAPATPPPATPPAQPENPPQQP